MRPTDKHQLRLEPEAPLAIEGVHQLHAGIGPTHPEEPHPDTTRQQIEACLRLAVELAEEIERLRRFAASMRRTQAEGPQIVEERTGYAAAEAPDPERRPH